MFQSKKYSYGFGAGLTIAFVLIQMLSQVNEKLEKLKYFTPFTLFNVQDIVVGKKEAVLQFLVLYAMGIVLFFLGIKRFEKRDLSL